MATQLTINTTPRVNNDAYSPIIWNVTSADANIKAVRADIYINGSYATTIDGVQQLGSTSIFDFDVRKIMQSHLVSELRTNITTLQLTDAITSACSVKIRLFEIVLSGGVHTHTWLADGAGTNYLESSTYFVSNMAIQLQEALAKFTAETSSKKLLTMRSNNNRIVKGVPFQIGCLSATSNLQVRVLELDSFENTLNTWTSATQPSLTYGKGIMEIPTSTFSDSNVAYLDIRLQTSVPNAHSETIRYKVVENCDAFPIFWQNHLGDFDHFDFGNEKKTSVSTTTKTIKKPLPTNFSVNDVGEVPITSMNKTKIKVSTGALSATELTFLENLIRNHTVVYKWDSAGSFLSYVITSHSRKVADNDDFINKISLTLKPSNEHIVQNGD